MEHTADQGLLARLEKSIRGLTRGQVLYYFAFGLCAFTTLMVRTTFESILGIAPELFSIVGYSVSALLLVLKIALEREAKWQYGVALGLVALCFISFWVAGAWRFSVLFLFIAAGKGISVRWLAVLALLIQLVVLIVTLTFAVPGLIKSFKVHRLVDGVWVARSSYGYSHPNMLGQVFVVIAASYAVLRFPRFHVADLAVYTAAGLAAGLLVASRTSVVAIVLVALLALLAPRVTRSSRSMRTMAVVALASFCGLAAFSFFMMVFYDPDVAWMNTVDSLLSKRFTMAHRFFEVFSPTAFGRDTMAVKVDDFLQDAPDNAYVRILVKQGIVPAVVLGALVFAAFFVRVRKGTWDACVAGLLVYAFVGLMEMYSINFTLNYFLIACSWALFGMPDEQGSIAGEVDEHAASEASHALEVAPG